MAFSLSEKAFFLMKVYKDLAIIAHKSINMRFYRIYGADSHKDRNLSVKETHPTAAHTGHHHAAALTSARPHAARLCGTPCVKCAAAARTSN